MFKDKPSIALYMREKTKNVAKKLLIMRRNQEKHTRLFAEYLSSALNHEITSPVNTVIIFMGLIMTLLQHMDQTK